MRYSRFDIENYKGIGKVTLDLTRPAKARVFTLIGLNESGKTTVLEAINLLAYKEQLDPLGLQGYGTVNMNRAIPIGRKANFNDSIVVKATVELGERDEEDLAAFMRKEYNATITQRMGTILIKQAFTFTNSRIDQSQPGITWTLPFKGKSIGKRGKGTYFGEQQRQAVVAFLKDRVPKILYFPNFLFEFPNRIYLENPPTEAAKHTYFVGILQDVLDAIGDKATVAQHVLARAKSSDPADKSSLESVLSRMGSHITETIFGAWDKTFRKPAGKKEIVVTISQEGNLPHYLQLRVKDGTEHYDIGERSLGFRWFFTFLVLTRYRGFRAGQASSVLFLLDEPASNLHSSAQVQLLQSFATLAAQCEIIFTTHSHHLINPAWLDGAYIVRNEGLDYDNDVTSFSASKTRIAASKYRDFVAQYPSNTTYFQPVLDVLDYSPGPLEFAPAAVMMEGRNDFHSLRFAQRHLPNAPEVSVLPGRGAGSLDHVIQLYTAWGRRFIILLDSDRQGKSEVARYEKEFGVSVRGRVFSLKDVDPAWDGNTMEDLFEEGDRVALTAGYPTIDGNAKKVLNRAIQEHHAAGGVVALSEGAKASFAKVLAFCAQHLAEQDPAKSRVE